MQQHAIELTNLGVDVAAYGADSPHLLEDAKDWRGVPIYAHKAFLGPFSFMPKLSESLMAFNAQIVHQHGVWQYPSIVASKWRRQTQRPVVISTQGMLEPWALSNSPIKKKLSEVVFERRNLEKASVIHCSRSEVLGVRSFGLKNPIAVLPNGADLTNSKRVWPRPSTFQTDDRKTLLFLGRIHPKKGISETLQAFARLKILSPNIACRWRIVFAGWDDGGHLHGFRNEASALGLDGDVSFPGPIFGDEKAATLASADAFILASYSEGFPMAVLEAWSHGLPVFKTRSCNIPEGFEAGAAIEITTDVDYLAKCFAQHLESPDLQNIGDAGRRLVETRFTWPLIAKELLAVYRWLLGDVPQPRCIELP